ncbi:5-formyltetrahydrofolate cyclo-ligase [Pikeienuella piscinae]|uniref:5-formyltetrahydrofolate cyclo-ligase n=1 Tax=Pikeienuella piscinae TaxID=2748098 RepID=A0A7L5BXW3_9RHOB|nr:5-formyltetrahydrofolate cyclo-ligase [Pikeienuella piscinae]QIE55086.1 5-formyltetrahydrofolate cyclo-ligase [Pikeienuella piscinae]
MSSDDYSGFASSPCFAHELVETESGYAVADPVAARDVARWRKAERERLIAERRREPVEARNRTAEAIAAQLDQLIAPGPGVAISLYWPFRGELDLRGWMRSVTETGARAALPIVTAKGRPLIFRQWTPYTRMARGVWNIPVPDDEPELTPDVVIAPLVGFDSECYRLGYGGGYFDRTLASLPGKPMVIGVGQAFAALPTIYPQWHDIPMDLIVTGEDTIRRTIST